MHNIKACFRWALRLHVRANTNVSSKLPQRHAVDDDFRRRMVTDDNWFQHFSPEIKRQNIELRQTTCSKKEIARRIRSAGKIKGTYSGKPRVRTGWFWFLVHKESANAFRSFRTLQIRRHALRVKRQLKRHVILQHDNARSHTAPSHIGENLSLSIKCSHKLPAVRT
jgi:hypothetical protein